MTDVNVPTIASADSVKMPSTLFSLRKTAANWQSSTNQLKPCKKKAQLGNLATQKPSVPCGWHSYCREQDRYTTVNTGNCLSSMAVS